VSHHNGSQKLELRKFSQCRLNCKLGIISWMNLSYNHELMDFLIGRNGNSITMVWTLGIAIMQKSWGNPREN